MNLATFYAVEQTKTPGANEIVRQNRRPAYYHQISTYDVNNPGVLKYSIIVKNPSWNDEISIDSVESPPRLRGTLIFQRTTNFDS
jgi:hypothetical protein